MQTYLSIAFRFSLRAKKVSGTFFSGTFFYFILHISNLLLFKPKIKLKRGPTSPERYGPPDEYNCEDFETWEERTTSPAKHCDS